jgi:putative endonuclease
MSAKAKQSHGTDESRDKKTKIIWTVIARPFPILSGRRSNLIIMEKQYYIYIMTNKWNKVLYTGITNDLVRRVYEHKQKTLKGFTKRYNVDKLVYYEVAESIESAILREKQIKGGSRKDKIDLVNTMNDQWNDLSETL